MSCAGCGKAVPTEFFSTQGDALCRSCFYAEQTRLADARVDEALLEPAADSLGHQRG